MGSERMPESVTGDLLGDSGTGSCLLYCPLEDRFVQVVPVRTSGRGVDILPRSREHPLPRPLSIRTRIFPVEPIRKFNVAAAFAQILFVPCLDLLKMKFQTILYGRGQDGHPGLAPLPLPDDDLSVSEIDVLHAKLQAFQEPETRAVHEHPGDPVLSIKF